MTLVSPDYAMLLKLETLIDPPLCLAFHRRRGIMANRDIAQRTMGDGSYTGSGGVSGVGDCTCIIPTLTDLRKASGPRIDRIQPARPSWRGRQYRELKKIIFSPPITCPIDIFGPLANGTILKRLHRHVVRLLVSYMPLAGGAGAGLCCSQACRSKA